MSSVPNLAIPDPILLQHFYMGLSKDSAQFLDTSCEGAFLYLSLGEGRIILDKILENTPYTGIHDEFPDEVLEDPTKEKP